MNDHAFAAAINQARDELSPVLADMGITEDLEANAQKIIDGLLARGWRPTAARSAPAWLEQAVGRGLGDEPSAEYRDAKQELLRRLAGQAEEEAGDGRR